MTTIAERYMSGRHKLLVGGWREGETGNWIAVRNPSNGEVLAEVADASLADARAAVDAAAAAAPGWAATAPRARAEVLRRCYELMIARGARARAADLARERQGVPGCARRGPLRGRVLPLVRRGDGPRIIGEMSTRALRAEPHSRALRAGWDRTPRHAVELPGRDGDAQDGARARRGLHRRAQAGDRDAADRARRRRDHARSRRARRRDQRHVTSKTGRTVVRACCTTRGSGPSPSPARPRSGGSS